MGKTRRGKGTQAVEQLCSCGLQPQIPGARAQGGSSTNTTPLRATSTPHAVTLIEPTLNARFTEEFPTRLSGDKAYDSDPPDEQLAEYGVE